MWGPWSALRPAKANRFTSAWPPLLSVPKQAKLNLTRELGSDSFDQTCERPKTSGTASWAASKSRAARWNSTRTFIRRFIGSLLFPRKFYELNENNEIVHYSPYNGNVLPGYMFTDNGFWDTFRAVFPFFTLMYPNLNAQIMEGLVNTYKESGWLPEWASPGHRDCMIGSNSAVLICRFLSQGHSRV